MAYREKNDGGEQMAFSFYEEMAPKKSIAEREFDTEDDALDALLGNAGQDDAEPEQPLPADCCGIVNRPANQTEPPSPEQSSGERDLPSSGDTGPGSDAPAVTDLETAEDADAAIDAIDEAMRKLAGVSAEAENFQEEIRAVIEEEKQQSGGEEPAEKSANPFPPLTEQTMRRAAAGFLAVMAPSGIGLRFPSGIPRIRIDAGAFFLSPAKKNPEITRTVLVMTCVNRDKCWFDAAEKETLLKALAEQKALKLELEEKLKISEPDLKDDSLFPESQTWDFSRSKSRKYHACLHRIEKLEYSIYHGSKFERLMFEQAATEYYLAVPEGLLSADELPDEWGLVFIRPDFTAAIVREAKKCDSPQANRTAFALRAAASGAPEFLFANGISLADGAAKFHLPPKRRKAYKN